MKVYAKNEEMAKLLKHPINKQGFRDVNTPAEWPADQFTTRRIEDGDVLTEEDKGKQPLKAETKPASEQQDRTVAQGSSGGKS
jgi:hypothetical protein